MASVKIGKDLQQGKIVVSFSYNPKFVAKVKAIEGHSWHPDKKYWSFPCSENILTKILSAFNGEDVLLDSTLQSSTSQKVDARLPNQSQITEAVKKELKLRGYSHKTQKAYLHHIERYISYFAKDPKERSEKHIRDYMLYLIDKEKVSRAYHDQAVSAIKFLYDCVLNMPRAVCSLPRPRKEKKLPIVLSREDVIHIFDSVNNIKHKAILMLAYSAGLRVSEVVKLKVQDIDTKRNYDSYKSGKRSEG